MGIPKFFRFMSERYPLISQLVQENRIPEFDALYLDMNGIIHNCSHPDDSNASFRISEHDIFLAIFAYISHLFSVIKPQKLFFLAVDGVAPRAKMNQQRSRRFRTAREAKEILDKARRNGEEIPEGDGFDSNCITPGTPFMARLSAQLKYFIAKKVTEDADWRNVEIVVSGHEVPGEGEHKVMEYIRLKKAQPDYDPNVRHCLYGLDADLIMLGLLSHDPHFCLLREEVNFGPRGGKKKGLELQNFFLLHLSLFREYLDLEFSSLKTAHPPLPFEYDLERIIDDFILLNIFVGNDFLPHLPGMHINEGALGRLFEIYKRILPQAGGYLNEHGVLNVQRLQLVLDELGVFEREHFEHEFADSSWFKGKQSKHLKAIETPKSKKLTVTQDQRKLLAAVRGFLESNLHQLSPNAHLTIPNTLPARDRQFLAQLAQELHLVVSYDQFDDSGVNIIVLSFDQTMLNLALVDEDSDSDDEQWQGAGAAGSAEWKGAIMRVLTKYERAEIERPLSDGELEDSEERQIQQKMDEWKRDYYREKLEFEPNDEQAVDQLAYRYIEGLQWVLHYYYSGVASWGWFYNYHYAPKMTDLKNAAKYKFKFELGKPFHPFEQLMGVLPDLSSQHIPVAFRDLMSDPTSPIIDFYPSHFEQDLNGKKQDWEAVVKIPFIDEKRLLATMASREPRLTAEERKRNSFGDSTRFTYTEQPYTYPSSLPEIFPDIVHCHCKLDVFHLPTLEGGLSYVKGLVAGALLGKDAISGFPSLHTIPHTGQLSYHAVSVFQGDSRNETMVITIDSPFEDVKSEALAELMVGKRIFAGYPYLREGMVTSISDELFRYNKNTMNGREIVVPVPHSGSSLNAWKKSSDRLEYVYSKKLGTIIGQVGAIAHVRLLKGLRRELDGSTVKEYEEEEQDFAVQSLVTEVSSEDVRYMEQPPLPVEIEYPQECKVFFLGEVAYGVPAQVVDHKDDRMVVRISFFPSDNTEPRLFQQRLATALHVQYLPSHQVARQLGMSGLALAKLTSSVMVTGGDQKQNIGLNLKFEAKGQKVLGYSQKGDSGWEFSPKAIELVREYASRFPEVVRALGNPGSDITRASDFFPDNANARMKELLAWLKEKKVRDFEKVPLYSEQLEKESVLLLEQVENQIVARKTSTALKQAVIQGIPRHALLKPAHIATRLREQRFSLGDRVICTSETGSVPLALKGVVVGIQTGFIDVVFDIEFMGGTTLGDRCSAYRGATLSPSSVLNVTDKQFITDLKHLPPAPASKAQRGRQNALFTRGPRGGPSVLPAQGRPAAGFHPAPPQPSRGRGLTNGGVRLLQKPARPFDGNYGAVARGDAPQPPASSSRGPQSKTPDAFDSLKNIGEALGIPVKPASSNGFPGRGGYQNRQPAPQVQAGFQQPNGSNNHHLFNGAPPYRGHSFPDRGRGHSRGRGGMNGHQPDLTPAQRGQAGQGFRAAPRGGGGVAIPPPIQLLQNPRGRGGRGRGGNAVHRGRGVSNASDAAES